MITITLSYPSLSTLPVPVPSHRNSILPPWSVRSENFIFVQEKKWNAPVERCVVSFFSFSSILYHVISNFPPVACLRANFILKSFDFRINDIKINQVVGYTAQIITIILSIPMIAVAKNAPGVQSFLEVDWLHFIETFLFWASIHVQTMSFRQAVLAVERKEPFPVSHLYYSSLF